MWIWLANTYLLCNSRKLLSRCTSKGYRSNTSDIFKNINGSAYLNIGFWKLVSKSLSSPTEMFIRHRSHRSQLPMRIENKFHFHIWFPSCKVLSFSGIRGSPPYSAKSISTPKTPWPSCPYPRSFYKLTEETTATPAIAPDAALFRTSVRSPPRATASPPPTTTPAIAPNAGFGINPATRPTTPVPIATIAFTGSV